MHGFGVVGNLFGLFVSNLYGFFGCLIGLCYLHNNCWHKMRKGWWILHYHTYSHCLHFQFSQMQIWLSILDWTKLESHLSMRPYSHNRRTDANTTNEKRLQKLISGKGLNITRSLSIWGCLTTATSLVIRATFSTWETHKRIKWKIEYDERISPKI